MQEMLRANSCFEGFVYVDAEESEVPEAAEGQAPR